MSFNTRQSRSRHEKKYCEILKLINHTDKIRKLEEEVNSQEASREE